MKRLIESVRRWRLGLLWQLDTDTVRRIKEGDKK